MVKTTGNELRGIVASPGIATGRAFVYVKPRIPHADNRTEDPAREIRRLKAAVAESVGDLQRLTRRMQERGEDAFVHILRAQQTIAEDESVFDEVATLVREDWLPAEAAVGRVFEQYTEMFNQLRDRDYNKARSADVMDVYKRIVGKLLGLTDTELIGLDSGTIVVAEDLLPSDTAMMDFSRVAALVTERGGVTGHVAIIANTYGIPAAVGVAGVTTHASSGDRMVVDASCGEEALVLVNPDAESERHVAVRRRRLEHHARDLQQYRGMDPITRDGHRIILSANVGSTAELEPARVQGAGSVGLYRTEFLFLKAPVLPDEDAQYEAYRAAAEAFPGSFVIVRTLDVGGDKRIPGISMEQEDNPFLGNRALRLCLARPDLFRTQLRAILRAAVHGDVRIMFPMVGGVPELEEALDVLARTGAELQAEGIECRVDLPVGAMIEVPAAVWVAGELARRVSFLSIGTNDLTQYLTATDRINSAVWEYHRIFDPSLFRAMEMVVAGAHANGAWVGVCGELGGNPLAIPLLIGLGVDELSMSPRAIAEATWLLRTGTYREMQALAEEVLKQDDHRAIRSLLEQFLEKHYTGSGEGRDPQRPCESDDA
ncbi:MAG: phosphoenolpyruvate--protein phosphotransferase [Spirochaetaceae bacterium]|nr:MAG: phosphoenolpyruvate--protein phosphotransferase [Spirochaetaceae bacterium]